MLKSKQKMLQDFEISLFYWSFANDLMAASETVKTGSDESHFNVPLIVRDKVKRQCPHTTTILKREESRSGIEPRSLCLPD